MVPRPAYLSLQRLPPTSDEIRHDGGRSIGRMERGVDKGRRAGRGMEAVEGPEVSFAVQDAGQPPSCHGAQTRHVLCELSRSILNRRCKYVEISNLAQCCPDPFEVVAHVRQPHRVEGE